MENKPPPRALNLPYHQGYAVLSTVNDGRYERALRTHGVRLDSCRRRCMLPEQKHEGRKQHTHLQRMLNALLPLLCPCRWVIVLAASMLHQKGSDLIPADNLSFLDPRPVLQCIENHQAEPSHRSTQGTPWIALTTNTRHPVRKRRKTARKPGGRKYYAQTPPSVALDFNPPTYSPTTGHMGTRHRTHSSKRML